MVLSISVAELEHSLLSTFFCVDRAATNVSLFKLNVLCSVVIGR